VISLLVGLGNVGPKYEGSRHNLGFEVLRRVATTLNASPLRERPFYRAALASNPDEEAENSELILAWPTTYVNRSGLAVRELLTEFDLGPDRMLVVSDDFNLPLGALRFRRKGSDGGHNGLESIIWYLETEEFPRLRLGIGPLSDKEEVTGFVLERFSEKESAEAERMVAKAAEAVIFATYHRLEEAMTRYNYSPALPEES
jgi:PTH1 family peptidyl-tRNA hydrolase